MARADGRSRNFDERPEGEGPCENGDRKPEMRAIVRGDASLRPGVVSLSHGWGGVVGDDSDPREVGSNVNPLISDHRNVEIINAMPRMTAIPVNIRAV